MLKKSRRTNKHIKSEPGKKSLYCRRLSNCFVIYIWQDNSREVRHKLHFSPLSKHLFQSIIIVLRLTNITEKKSVLFLSHFCCYKITLFYDRSIDFWSKMYFQSVLRFSIVFRLRVVVVLLLLLMLMLLLMFCCCCCCSNAEVIFYSRFSSSRILDSWRHSFVTPCPNVTSFLLKNNYRLLVIARRTPWPSSIKTWRHFQALVKNQSTLEKNPVK